MHVLFFAQLKDATGNDSCEFSVTAPLTTNQLWTELVQKFPALAAHRSSVRLAKNHEYAKPDTTFDTGDEVALIPPVSGG